MIALGSDHAGYDLKEVVKAHLDERGLKYKDYGTYDTSRCDYPVYGFKAAQAVSSGECDRGIICCGSGVGISIAANKVKGIRCVCMQRAVFGHDVASAQRHQYAIDGSRIVGTELAKMIMDCWLDGEFEGGRHADRVAIFTKIEEGQPIE